MPVTEREKLVLNAIIDFYLTHGETIGSRTLVKKYNINLSSATIRNVMADLEDMGYISKTHTSSGRIPTDTGYKYYLDELLKIEKLSREEKARIDLVYENRMRELDSVLQKTSSLLSKLTNYTGIVIEPNHHKEKIKKIELVHIDDFMAMAVIVMENKAIRTKKIFLEERVTREHLMELSISLNERIQNDDLDSHEVDGIIKGIYEEVEGKLFLENTSVMFKDKQVNEISDVLELFSKQKGIKELLEEVIKTKTHKYGTVNVLMGEELPIKGLEDYSFVYSVYKLGDSQGI
ncbi:MAG: heat-inducible transcriptional repressor HrcA, partial [Cetobacterium sp.]